MGEAQKEATKMSVEELREVFDQFDENGDGQLSLEEFAQAFRAFGEPDKEVHAAFKKCDKDGNRKLSKQELVKAFKAWGHPITETEVERSFKTHDLNGDGQLDFEEFKKMMLE